MRLLIALFSGLLFGIGLIASGMTDPSKVQGFLDLAGKWDPSLALVMGGALVVASFAFAYAAKRQKTMFGDPLHLPTATKVDRPLVWGSLTFGLGWGLAGYCPGPVLASIAVGGIKPWLFAASMIAGMALYELLTRTPKSQTPAQASKDVRP
jgi:uncharacterized membrane protein YedE/YeeE